MSKDGDMRNKTNRTAFIDPVFGPGWNDNDMPLPGDVSLCVCGVPIVMSADGFWDHDITSDMHFPRVMKQP